MEEEGEKVAFMRLKWGLKEWRRGMWRGKMERRDMAVAEEWRVFRMVGLGFRRLRVGVLGGRRARELERVLREAWARVLLGGYFGRLRVWVKWRRGIRKGVERRRRERVGLRFEDWAGWTGRRKGGRGVVGVFWARVMRRAFGRWLGVAGELRREERVVLMGQKVEDARVRRVVRAWMEGSRRRAKVLGEAGVLVEERGERGGVERAWGVWEAGVLVRRRGRKELEEWRLWARGRRKGRGRLVRRALWAVEFREKGMLKKVFRGFVAWREERRARRGVLVGLLGKQGCREGFREWKLWNGKARKVERMVGIMMSWRRWHNLHDVGREERAWREGFGEFGRVFFMWKKRVEIMCEREKENWLAAVKFEERSMLKKGMFGFVLGNL